MYNPVTDRMTRYETYYPDGPDGSAYHALSETRIRGLNGTADGSGLKPSDNGDAGIPWVQGTGEATGEGSATAIGARQPMVQFGNTGVVDILITGDCTFKLYGCGLCR